MEDDWEEAAREVRGQAREYRSPVSSISVIVLTEGSVRPLQQFDMASNTFQSLNIYLKLTLLKSKEAQN